MAIKQLTISILNQIFLNRLLFFGLLFVLWGCNNDNLTEMTPPDQNPEERTEMTLIEAKAEIECLVGQIDLNKTRSGTRTRKIFDYYCVGGQATTRSSELPGGEELTTYVFNFADNNGFAIVAGDKRIETPILVLTDEGYLNPEEEVDNPWLATYLMLADNYCKTEIAKAEPFNNNIPLINGQKPPLGCTATATMLLMAWYQYPQVYNGYQYNWTEILKYRDPKLDDETEKTAVKYDLARLSEIITRKENLDMTFGPISSGAWLYNIPRTLKNLGYFHGGTHAEWNKTTVLNELKNYPHYPVAVSAYAYSTDTTTGVTAPEYLGIKVSAPEGYSSGHSFLLKSAIIRERKIKYPDNIYYPGLKVKQETLVYVK